MIEYLLYNKEDKSYLMSCGTQFTFHKDNALSLTGDKIRRIIEVYIADGIHLMPVTQSNAPICSLDYGGNVTLVMS